MITFVVLTGLSLPAVSAPAQPTISPATDGIFVAFKTHPLVGLGELHGLAQELDFYVTLLRDPRFAAEVGNIVVEVGDAAQQAVIDRYVNGEEVPYAELRKVWSDTVGWYPTVTFAGSINIYSTIREVNAKLPPDKRIKVWLGEPPIDWTAIKTREDFTPLEKQRDSYPVELVAREILAKSKKALMIYGAGHFGIYPDFSNLRSLLDTSHPGALFVISPYTGYAQADCAARFEPHIKGWTAPSLVGPIKGSTLEADIWRKGCNAFTKPPELKDEAFEASGRNNLGLTSDALLYLGPRQSLVYGPRDLDILLDLDYRAEMNRRMILRTGQPLGPPNTARNVPQPFFPD
ncbi:MAG: hypothetical protein H0U98_08455 [Alphaproteobacteria bacterium]|nr:hypothetical protein [Alphaproteobacteria bacterium]